ncbi:MAG: hypothetical protein JJU24_16085 [Natronohydrobacter sp.]|nr:hypothetical protein [Natronohydrobacter sp.]
MAEGYTESATEAQIRSIEDFYNTSIDFRMSSSQANRLLSIRDYVRGVADILSREGRRVSGDHMRLVAGWVVNEDDMSAQMVKWNADRFRRGTHNETPKLRRNSPLFQKVYERMREVSC